MPTSAPVGNAQADYIEIDPNSRVTVSVPYGEVWKFTLVTLTGKGSETSGKGGRTSDTFIGFDLGSASHEPYGTANNNAPLIGTGTNDVPMSVTVDGNNMDGLSIYNGYGTLHTAHWNAVRVS